MLMPGSVPGVTVQKILFLANEEHSGRYYKDTVADTLGPPCCTQEILLRPPGHTSPGVCKYVCENASGQNQLPRRVKLNKILFRFITLSHRVLVHSQYTVSAELLPGLCISLQDKAFLSHSCKGMMLLGASLHG